MINLKKALEGYDVLHSSGKLDKISNIKLDLTNKHIGSIDGKGSKTIFGKATIEAELVTRQYLLMLFADLNLNTQILESVAVPEKGITLQLPAEWRKTISSHGVKVSKLRSAYQWNYFLISRLVALSMRLFKAICNCILQLLNVRKTAAKSMTGKYAYFFSLNGTNLPQPDKAGVSYDFISWYINWPGRSKDVKGIYHNVKNQNTIQWRGRELSYLDNPFLPFYTKQALFKYCLWCIKAVFVSVISLFSGRWWNILMLAEAIQAAKMRYQEPDLLAEEYYFNNSMWIYRPLWTYEAEANGSKIHFYFYSTNCETIASTTMKTEFHYGYQCMNWPHYLVWDAYQARFVRDAVGKDANVSVVGPIWFSTSSKELPVLPDGVISVFDVQPMRDAFYKTLGITFEYYIPKVCTQFLADIFEVSTSLDLTMAWKRKRDVGKKVHPTYRNFIEKIESSTNFITVDADISAIKLIEKSSMVISMPFTSTAILARELKKPSIYYDSLNMLQKNDPVSHGILVISNITDLRKWVISNL